MTTCRLAFFARSASPGTVSALILPPQRQDSRSDKLRIPGNHAVLIYTYILLYRTIYICIYIYICQETYLQNTEVVGTGFLSERMYIKASTWRSFDATWSVRQCLAMRHGSSLRSDLCSYTEVHTLSGTTCCEACVLVNLSVSP